MALKMDVETGEYCTDVETGEGSYNLLHNCETGEYEGNAGYYPLRKFKIPNEFITEKTPWKTKNGKPVRADKYELELITAAIFLLPTMILFYPVLSVFVIIFEIMLHNWSHKKNKSLKDNSVYYQSPLHVIVKEFCGRCKDENATKKITKIQNIRNDKLKNYSLEYIRRVVT